MTYQSRLKSGLFISLDSRSVYAPPRAMTCVTPASNAALRDLGIMTIKAGTGVRCSGGNAGLEDQLELLDFSSLTIHAISRMSAAKVANGVTNIPQAKPNPTTS